MYVQKQKELQKQYDKQEKKLKQLKDSGKSSKQAVSMSAPRLLIETNRIFPISCTFFAHTTGYATNYYTRNDLY